MYENALCNFFCFTGCLGLSFKIKEIGRMPSESAVIDFSRVTGLKIGL